MKNHPPVSAPTPGNAAPKKKHPILWGILGFFIIGGIISQCGGGPDSASKTDTPSPTPVASASQSSAPEPEPQSDPAEPAPDPVVTPISEEEAVAEFQAFVDDRKAHNVSIANAITGITISNGVVSVAFDPASAGVDQETFDAINPFPNLAEFVGTPMTFADEQGNRLRTVVKEVHATDASGNVIGTATAAELYKIGTGEDLPAGQ